MPNRHPHVVAGEALRPPPCTPHPLPNRHPWLTGILTEQGVNNTGILRNKAGGLERKDGGLKKKGQVLKRMRGGLKKTGGRFKKNVGGLKKRVEVGKKKVGVLKKSSAHFDFPFLHSLAATTCKPLAAT